MIMKKQLFIRGDLNSFQEGNIPLANQVWIAVLKDEYGEIKNDMKIWLYEEVIKNEKRLLLVFPGIIHDIGKNEGEDEEYEIIVNESDMKYLSESEEFKEYSVEDVINRDRFEKKYQELFGEK